MSQVKPSTVAQLIGRNVHSPLWWTGVRKADKAIEANFESHSSLCTIRKATRGYKCAHCGRIIPKGSIHASAGTFANDHYCLLCCTTTRPDTQYATEHPINTTYQVTRDRVILSDEYLERLLAETEAPI